MGEALLDATDAVQSFKMERSPSSIIAPAGGLDVSLPSSIPCFSYPRSPAAAATAFPLAATFRTGQLFALPGSGSAICGRTAFPGLIDLPPGQVFLVLSICVRRLVEGHLLGIFFLGHCRLGMISVLLIAAQASPQLSNLLGNVRKGPGRIVVQSALVCPLSKTHVRCK